MNTHQALKILQLNDPPTPLAIKQAFRFLALRYHPDRNPNNPEASALFRQCAEAYNYLVEHPEEWELAPTASQTVGGTAPHVVQDLNDIFDDIFGFSREDRILGYLGPQDRLDSFEKCSTCQGSGTTTKRLTPICTHCFGGGRIKVGLEETFKICPKCGGRGRRVAKPCPVCDGFGRVKKKTSWLKRILKR